MNDDTLVYFGDAVKALGSGRVGGYLVRFGSPETPDRQGDYFDAATYFGAAIPGRVDAYYHHGLPRRGDAYAAELGNRPIGVSTVKALDDGLYAETDLDLAIPAVARLYAEFEGGRYLGYSSGSDVRLVKYEPVKAGVTRVARWPINDTTLSPVPVDMRNRALPLKAYIESRDDGADAGRSFAESLGRADAAVAEATGLLRGFAERRAADGRPLSLAKCRAAKALADRVDALNALVAEAESRAPVDPERAAALRRRLLSARL